MTTGRRDIETRTDCDQLVRAFYEKALADSIIGFIFVDVAQLDLEAHLPVIASFWETILLGGGTYSGNAFGVHVELHKKVGLQEGHFKRWLGLWFQTVDDLFEGDCANLAKTHALRVAQAFHERLQSFPSPRSARESRGLVITHHGRFG